jgi:hypothetical protein
MKSAMVPNTQKAALGRIDAQKKDMGYKLDGKLYLFDVR